MGVYGHALSWSSRSPPNDASRIPRVRRKEYVMPCNHPVPTIRPSTGRDHPPPRTKPVFGRGSGPRGLTTSEGTTPPFNIKGWPALDPGAQSNLSKADKGQWESIALKVKRIPEPCHLAEHGNLEESMAKPQLRSNSKLTAVIRWRPRSAMRLNPSRNG